MMTSSDLDKVLDIHRRVVLEGFLGNGQLGSKTYAVSNLRGGVGKTSISFNLAYEVSRKRSLLVADVCPQTNLTEVVMRRERPTITIYNALQPRVLGPAFGEEATDIAFRASQFVPSFAGGKGCFFISGDAELYEFPSYLYQQLGVANTRSNKDIVRTLLWSLKDVLESEAKALKCDCILIDTSPFYSGGTHLAWCAADSLIVPVRVDEHSVESLALLMKILSDPKRDFVLWNQRGGDLPSPRIAAIVMTMAGAKSQKEATPDAASRMFIERALKIAKEHSELFHNDDPADSFVITDDFMSAGRISGAESVPIANLKVGRFHTVAGRRLQVNESAQRYQRELAYLASIL
ncbi:MAG: ParA family protein [Acetobacteraceae bacterium]|nr:ParA family protein [Acetobacteraceae bacterium]